MDEVTKYTAAPVDRLYDASSFSGIASIADGLVKSGLWKMTTAQAYAILQTGKELGLSPTAALNGIHIIQGKATMSGQLMVAMVQRAGHRFEILESTDACARVRLTRRDGTVREAVFSFEDAKRAGLVSKDVWRSYPRAMLLNRAISECARYGAPDALGGMVYTPSDFDAVEIDGEIIPPLATLSAGPAPEPTFAEHVAERLEARQAEKPPVSAEADAFVDEVAHGPSTISMDQFATLSRTCTENGVNIPALEAYCKSKRHLVGDKLHTLTPDYFSKLLPMLQDATRRRALQAALVNFTPAATAA